MLGGWAVFALSGHVQAESRSEAKTVQVRSTKDYWEQQVLRSGPPQAAVSEHTSTSRRLPPSWSPNRPSQTWAPVKPVSDVFGDEPAAGEPSEGDLLLGEMESIPSGKPLPDDDAYYQPGPYGAAEEAYPTEGSVGECFSGCSGGECYDGCSCEACSSGCSCGAGCGGYQCEGCFGDCSSGAYCGGPYGLRGLWQGWWHRNGPWVRHLSFFAGVHGFKGPADQGRNGNFGFHEGLNWGGPLGGPFDLGYQLGMQAVHSNFHGDQTTSSVTSADRDQIFFTGGIFRRRLCGGVQWGVVFDLLHDRYHGSADLKQVRNETALVFSGGWREIGYWGAYGVGDDAFTYRALQRQLTQPMGPTDIYALFYRRHFSGGGQGRIWAGLSGDGDGLIGADCTVPLGTSWALENNFTYLIPKEGAHSGGQQDETWSVSIQLVWYPGREAACVLNGPFNPLFNVADNSHFLLRDR
jgi:hypothetical protein